MILPRQFYLRADVVEIARDLLGKYLCTEINGVVSSGMITETEAYGAVTDKASHAYGGRRTPRTEIMYRQGGTAYVYLCYGMHSLFNVVTNAVEIPHAVLIRGIRPVEGIDAMLSRIGKTMISQLKGTGPGIVTKLLGIHYSMTGLDLTSEKAGAEGVRIWIEDRGWKMEDGSITVTTRVGVDYAGEDAKRQYRFILRERGY